MKIPYQQLEQQLGKGLASIYLISSDEILLVQETTELIKQSALQAGFSERTLITADSGNEWSKALHSHSHSISLFASKQIIELNMHQAKFSATTTKALQDYVENPPRDILLIIRTNKVDGKTEKAAWFQKLEKNCVYISIWPIPAAQLPQWILQRAKKLNVSITKQNAELLATQVEGNLLAAAQEIEKLHLLQINNPTNTTHNITNDTSDAARFNVFDLVESTIAKNNSRSLRILNHLAEEDTEPTLILWALTREFRMLADMFAQLKQGASISTLFNKFHIFEKRQPNIRNFLQRQTINTCWEKLLQAAQIDRMIKGGEKGNVWDGLENLVL